MECMRNSTYVLKQTPVPTLTFQTSVSLFRFSLEKVEDESSIVIWAQQKPHRLGYESLPCHLLKRSALD